MAQYIVMQRPRQKYRSSLVTAVMVVEAKTGAEAVRIAIEKGKVGLENWFGPSPEYTAPLASPLVVGRIMAF